MFEQVQHLLQVVDRAVEEICQEYPAEVHCSLGCADCCHAVFDVSFIEAAYIASFLKKHPDITTSQKEHAEKAAIAYEQLNRENGDPSTARIRCPLLSEDNICLAHLVRPINCRTYGTPTDIAGKGHVCGLSGFSQTGTYPTIKLSPLQESLQSYSIQLVGPDFGTRRFPLSWVVLKTDIFLPEGNG